MLPWEPSGNLRECPIPLQPQPVLMFPDLNQGQIIWTKTCLQSDPTMLTHHAIKNKEFQNMSIGEKGQL